MPLVCRFHIFSYVPSYDGRLHRTRAATYLALAVFLSAVDSHAIASPEVSGELEVVIERDRSSPSTETGITVDVTVEPWTSTVEAEFESGAWTRQGIEITWASETAEFASRLRFEPSMDRFRDWRSEATCSLGATEVELEYRITRTRGWLILDVEWVGERSEFDARLRRRSVGIGTPLRFYDANAEATVELLGAELTVAAEIDDDGFSETVLEIQDVTPGPTPWLTLDLNLERTLSDTTIEITSTIGAGEIASVELDFAVDPDDGRLDSLRLTELAAEGDLAGAELEGQILFDPDEWIDDVYTASIDAEIGFGRDGAFGLELLWSEIPQGNGLPARAMPRLSFEFVSNVSLEIEVDLLLRPVRFLALACTISW